MNNGFNVSTGSGQRYRMIAIDMDGTLLSPNGTVTPRTKRAIHGALKKGWLVCFATGRNWTESQLILESVDHFPMAVFVGGAMVVDTKRRLTLHRKLMNPKLAAQLCGFFENQSHAAMAVQDKSTAGNDYLVSDHLAMHPACEIWMTSGITSVQRMKDLANHPHDHTMRVSVVASAADIDRLTAELEKEFGDRVVAHNMPTAGVAILEVFDPAVNKWQGLLHVAQAHGIDPKEVIAIGDDVNDLPMICNAGLGVAMGNAKDVVRAAAGRVIGKNSEDGLAKFLEELVMNHEIKPLVE